MPPASAARDKAIGWALFTGGRAQNQNVSSKKTKETGLGGTKKCPTRDRFIDAEPGHPVGDQKCRSGHPVILSVILP